VRLRIDEGGESVQSWGVATDGKALFARQQIALMKSLAEAKTIAIEYIPFREAPRILTFDLKGLSDLLPRLRKACNW
jgi:hypothetical protein